MNALETEEYLKEANLELSPTQSRVRRDTGSELASCEFGHFHVDAKEGQVMQMTEGKLQWTLPTTTVE
jgi:hypothetical protein